MTYEEALQIAKEELDEKIEHLSETFKGHSAGVESYIYNLSMSRKALMQELKDAEKEREWVGLTGYEIRETIRGTIEEVTISQMVYCVAVAKSIEAKLKEKNKGGLH